MDQEYLQKPVSHLYIAVDAPLIRAMTTTNEGVLTHRFQEVRLVLWNNVVFDSNQHWATRSSPLGITEDSDRHQTYSERVGFEPIAGIKQRTWGAQVAL